MADKKISDLTETTTAADGDWLLLENAGGNSRKINRSNFRPKFRGCLAKKLADQTTANYTTETAVAFDGADEYDTDSIHDPASNNTRLTVPSGASFIRLTAAVAVNLASATDWLSLRFRKGGASSPIGCPSLFLQPSDTVQRFGIQSAPLAVSATNYFELMLQLQADTSVTIEQFGTWFAMEIIE